MSPADATTTARVGHPLDQDLHTAASAGELRLAYQPILDLEDESVVGVEALVRWQHPVQGLVGPVVFMPYAERSGLIVDIGDWVIREACRQSAAWAAAAATALPLIVSINISDRQLAQGAGLLDSVRAAVDASGTDPSGLVMEVTEAGLVADAETGIGVLHELKSLGVKLAIDDLGAGYSSHGCLTRTPVDLLKIDRSFVAGLGHSEDDTATVRGVIELAHAFDIQAVAEGIETRGQLATLQNLGCGYGQGYLWSPGRPAADLGPILFRA